MPDINNPYSCSQKYITESNDFFLSWSLITQKNIKYDNFISYYDFGKNQYIIKSNNTTSNILFEASINLDEKTLNSSFTIDKISYDNIIDSGIKTGMNFKYQENKNNSNITWYEVENTNIKLIPDNDCPIEIKPEPTPDQSMKCNPKCSQILDTSSGKRCDPTLISDKSSYLGTIKWSIISNNGKQYDGFTIKYEKTDESGIVYLDVNNDKDKNFKMSLGCINFYGVVSFKVNSINDSMKLGIKEDYAFEFIDKDNSYSYTKDNNIKIIPTSCINNIPYPYPYQPQTSFNPSSSTHSSKNAYSIKTLFFIIGILFLITGLILFFYKKKFFKMK